MQAKQVKDFFNSNILFLNIPFKRDLIDPTFYKQQIDSVVEYVNQSSVQFLIFASSTSIYPEGIKLAQPWTYIALKQVFDEFI